MNRRPWALLLVLGASSVLSVPLFEVEANSEGGTFVLAVAQIGPVLVLIPVTIWVSARNGTAWGTVFLVWAICCSTLDNVLRPMLIRRGADLSLLLIFAGVIGGFVAFGAIALFIRPVVLAVAHAFLADWVSEGDPPEPVGPPAQAT